MIYEKITGICVEIKRVFLQGLPVVVDGQIHDLLVAWINKQHGDDGPETRIFSGLRWENLLTMLGRIVSRETLKKAEGNGPIGSKVNEYVYKLAKLSCPQLSL